MPLKVIDPLALTSKLYATIQEAEIPRVMHQWHASSLAQCPRAQFLARQGVPRLVQPGAGKILRWQAGHLIEQVIRPYLAQEFPDLLSNVRMTNKELDLTGEFDNYSPSAKALIEIKSVSSHAVKYKKVADTRHHLRDEQQYLHHEYQQHAYVALMGDTQPVEQIVYLYITLDGLIVSYVTPVKPVLVEAVRKRLELLQGHWAKQMLPPCFCDQQEHPLYRGQMQYCDYKEPTGCCKEELWLTTRK